MVSNYFLKLEVLYLVMRVVSERRRMLMLWMRRVLGCAAVACGDDTLGSNNHKGCSFRKYDVLH